MARRGGCGGEQQGDGMSKKRIVPCDQWDYDCAGEGVKWVLDRHDMLEVMDIDYSAYDNIADLAKAIKKWARNSGQTVLPLSHYEHSGHVFRVVDWGYEASGWDYGNAWVVLDSGMHGDGSRVTGDWLTELHEGGLMRLEVWDKTDKIWLGEDIMTSSIAAEYAKKNRIKMYRYQEVTSFRLVEVAA